MKKKKTTNPKTPEERPLTKSSQNGVVLENHSNIWNTDSNSDEELTDEDLLNEKKRKNSTTKTYQKYQRYICYGIILAVIVVAVIISVLVWLHVRSKHKLCDTPTCKEASAYIVGKMNLSADPCDNFYNYVCGSWLKNLKVPKSRAKYNVFSIISDENDAHLKKIINDSSYTLKGNFSSAVKKVKTFYNLCMNEQQIEDLGIAPILELIKELGSWTVTSNPEAGVTWNKDSWDFFQALIKMNSYSSAPLFYFGVTTDDKNSSNKIGFFEQSGLTLNDREDYFKNNTGYDKLHEAYIKFAVEVAKLLGNNDTTDVRKKMEAVFQLETKLAEIHVPREKLLDPEKNYHKMTLKDLQQIMGNALNLTEYMSHVVGKPIKQTEKIIVYTPDYFKKIGSVITNTEKSVMANYFVWHFINELVGYFPKRFIDAGMILSEAERGTTTIDPRWQRCMGKAQGNFGYVLSALYVQDYFSDSSRQKVKEIAQEVRDAFVRNLPTVSWMDEKNKKYCH
ncbi:hypothetical protein KUTeg_015705 [Tegillarca granosa]|uniref:Peptidase M13 N-terminal domain-containing protein n=1 Tax=Tegillarca granosa TaxID=220873 RepID=A0ABQ9EN22_TEGGR|nr:hypothetical protein KUTeg_015705 [Tegillarca granosa]